MRVVLLAANREPRESIAAILETRGHDVLRFSEGERALTKLRDDQTTNAFLVLDLQKAEQAVELCWEARLLASSERPIYICLVSRPMSPEGVVEALDCGADDVMQLPLCANELYARLRSAERFNQMQLKLVELATRDGLTGLLNRPAFFHRAIKICKEGGAPIAAIMADVDHFKSVNDRFGHAWGDKALKSVAENLARRADVAARLGGEEFVLLLPASSPEHALAVAEDLRRAIASCEIDVDGTPLRLSCSFGVAVAQPGAEIDDLLRRADCALYAAKRGGRDRVVVHDDERPCSVSASLIRHAGERRESRRRAAV
ncbi:diguanylate cyclase [Rhodoblastus acidophilus]|uniref:diguanylate cyclase n=1 Tax=Candidatus Rhodoblastus alkanivorans TaxID=2954117 RepID=A0ABS9Z3C8_9HYPH|nr:diguanylate cyclase [Candidatus Rhodoblastus alkanivorans]MCI4678790.1 diguanylate cyclase [Candidatus Rhodoblastus alkanivorans]MCI4682179.1 diguanylate cyclase [Candidatus Rhodoblastus alkanivorans]MDI4639481.1 diguanylate cyclase [Rhodoblastus acidophilus]